jgi:hypothetical protein
VNIQKEIYTKTMDYLEPICPAIVFSQIYKDESDISGVLKSIHNHTLEGKKTRSLLDSILSKSSEFNLGIIVMEFADGYMKAREVSKLPSDDPKQIHTIWIECIFKYILLELALKTGYHHADFHKGNLLIKPDDTSNVNPYRYFDIKRTSGQPILGKPLIIDFGLSVKIQEPILKTIKDECAKKDYLNALQKLCEIPRKDHVKINKKKSNWATDNYGWVCNTQMQRVAKDSYHPHNIVIDRLFSARERSKEILKDTFNKTHPEGPHLPLNNDVSRDAVKGDTLIEKDEPIKSAVKKSTVKKSSEKTSKKRITPTIISKDTSAIKLDEIIPELVTIPKSPKILKRVTPRHIEKPHYETNNSSPDVIISSKY